MSDSTPREAEEAAPPPDRPADAGHAEVEPDLGEAGSGSPGPIAPPRAGVRLDAAHVPIAPVRPHGLPRPSRSPVPPRTAPDQAARDLTADRTAETGHEAATAWGPEAATTSPLPVQAAEPIAEGAPATRVSRSSSDSSASSTVPAASDAVRTDAGAVDRPGPPAIAGVAQPLADQPRAVTPAAGDRRRPWSPPGSAAPFLPDVASWPGVGALRRGVAVVFRPGELADAVVPTLAIRLGLLAFAAIGITTFGDAGARAQDLGTMWNHWDGPHFLEVAARGYDPTGDPARAVLFPLYPALIYLGSFLLAPLVVAMTITLVSTLVAAVGLYRLVRPHGRALARGSVLAMSLFPVAYFLIAPYSEAPFLAFTVWAFVAAREDRWAVAGTLGMLAAMTRLQGAFLLPALAIDYAVRRRRAGLPIVSPALAWIAVVAVGPLVFLAVNAYAYGDPLFFLSMQKKVFNVETIAPWQAMQTLWGNVTSHPGGESWTTVYLAPFVSFLVLGAVAVWSSLSRRSTPGFATYTWLTLASLATLSWPISVPRYLIDVFPIYIAGAEVGRRRDVGAALVAVSVLLLGAFTILYVEGHWAF